MGYAAILIGFVVLVALCMLNINVIISAYIAAFTVTLVAGLPLADSMVTTFFTRFGSIAGTLLPMFLFGAILAKLFSNSGAAAAIADKICDSLFKLAKTEKSKYALGFLSIILSAAILCYGGINAAVAIIAVYPIALRIFKRAGIPKRFIMGAICGGAFTFALSGPGSPEPTNVVAMVIGTTPYCGLVAGIAGIIVEIVIMVLMLTRMCSKATAQGETFVPGPKDGALVVEDQVKPKVLVALIPPLVLLIVFNVLSVNISFSILITAIVAAVLFYPQLGRKKIFESVNEGAVTSLAPTCAIAGVNGFAAVVQSVPEYQQLIDSMLHAAVPPVLLLVMCIAVICMMTGGSTTGTQIALPIITPALTKLGLSLPFIHRVGVFSATMLDSLPNSGAVIMAIGLADLKMKEGYPAVFASTVLATTCGTVVVAVIMTLFPMLP
ncbi:MAG: GntP family permease [Oscillospiraceae bacterium]|nr:GntP family permease [Oscillospiraceae bacterium]